MSRKEAGKAIAVTVEQFEREQRRRGGGPDLDHPNWLRRVARAELESRMDAHKDASIDLSNIFNHRAEGQKLQTLFDRVVNGTGNDANKAAVFVLAHYKLRLV